ncbi:MAG: ABC transporter ATP-binding protein [Chloroflexota bacterium]
MWGGLQRLAELPEEQATQRGAVARRLGEYLWPFRRQLAIILVLTLISAASQALGPLLIGRAIDGAIAGGDTAALNWTMLQLLVVYVGGTLAGRAQFALMGEVGQRTLARLRSEIFAALQRLSLSYYDRRPAGDLMSRLVNDTEVLNQLLGQGLVQVVGSLFGLVGILVAMIALDWRLALASFAVIPVLLWVTNAFSRMARSAFRRARATLGDVSSEIQEEIAGVKVAQAFSRTDVNRQRFAQRNAASRDANVSATAITSAFTPAVDVLSTVATAIVAGFGGYLVLQELATVGVVVAFLTYVQQFFRPIQALAGFYTTAQAGLAAAERVFDLTDTSPDVTDAPDAQEMPPIVGRVEFDHVSFTYGERPSARPAFPAEGPPAQRDGANGSHPAPAVLRSADGHGLVLQDISLVAEPGQTIAIVGPTGAGKTTLVNLIGRFYDVAEGAVRIDGRDVREVTRASLRRQMGVVLQDSFLFAGTIAYNIRYGRLDATDEEVVAAAKAANAHDFIMRLPEGYETKLGERGGGLSQGQRQLIGIARAILANPRILILDEATSSVDTRTEQLIQAALKTLLRGRTSFVIAHRLSTVRDADQVLVLEQGRIVERGTHTELLARGGLYAELYRRQFRDAAADVSAAA